MTLVNRLVERLLRRPGQVGEGSRDFEEEIPRYPPFARGLPVATAQQLVKTQQDLIREIKVAMGMPGEKFDALVLPVIHRFAEYVHLLPASENHHHRGAGGLFRHSLEVGFFALRASEAVVFTRQAHPSAIKKLEPRWRMAAFLGGLFHDTGKPISDLTVVSPDGKYEWNVFTDPTLYEWATRLGIERYHLRWTPNRHGRHERHTPHALYQLMTSDMKGYMQEAGKEVPEALMDALTGLSVTTPLSKLIIQADSNSVEKDLREQHIGHVDPHAVGVAAERYIVSAMRSLVSEGEWKANQPGSLLWIGDDGAYINWRQAVKQITQRLERDKIPGIPQSPESLAEILLERDLAEGQRVVKPGDEVVTLPYWHIRIDGIDMGRGVGKIDFLALKMPTDILYSAVTPPPPWDDIALVEDDDEAAAKTASDDEATTETASDDEAAAKTASDDGAVAKTVSDDGAVAKTVSDDGAVAEEALEDRVEPSDDGADEVSSDPVKASSLPSRLNLSGKTTESANDAPPELDPDHTEINDDHRSAAVDTEEGLAPPSEVYELNSLFPGGIEPDECDEAGESEAAEETAAEAIKPNEVPKEPSSAAEKKPDDAGSDSISARARPASQALTSRLGKPAAAKPGEEKIEGEAASNSPLKARQGLAAPPSKGDKPATSSRSRTQSLGHSRKLSNQPREKDKDASAAVINTLLEGLESGEADLGERLDITPGGNVHAILPALADALGCSEAEAVKALFKARLVPPGTQPKPRLVLKGKAVKGLLRTLRETPAYRKRQEKEARHQTPVAVKAKTEESSLPNKAGPDAGQEAPEEKKWWRDSAVTESTGKRETEEVLTGTLSESEVAGPVQDEMTAIEQLAKQMRAGKGRWLTATLHREPNRVRISDVTLHAIREENPRLTVTRLKSAIRRRGGEIGMTRQAQNITVTLDRQAAK